MLHIFRLICLVAPAVRADSRNQTFDDFATPLPVKPGDTLVIGIVGGWERWDNPARYIRRTAIAIKRHMFQIDEQARLQTFFLGAHLVMEFHMALWREVEQMLTSAALERD